MPLTPRNTLRTKPAITEETVNLIKDAFAYELLYNDKRTRTTRRFKCVLPGAEYNADEYDAKLAGLVQKLSENKIEYNDIFFVKHRPGTAWEGVALHLIVPI